MVGPNFARPNNGYSVPPISCVRTMSLVRFPVKSAGVDPEPALGRRRVRDVQPQIARHQIGMTVVVEVPDGEAVPPAARSAAGPSLPSRYAMPGPSLCQNSLPLHTGRAKVGSTNDPSQAFHAVLKVWALKEALLKANGGDVRTMKDADVSPLMTDTFLDGFYTVNLGEKDQRCFIHESGCGAGHHRVFTTLPVRKKDPDN